MPAIPLSQPIAPREPSLSWEVAGPGLYEGELAMELDSGELAAISVEPEWLENGAGVAFKGNARWIKADGESHLSKTGAHVEAAFSATASLADVAVFGVSAMAAEIASLILGEPPHLMRPADAANDVVERPVFDLPPAVLDSISIAKAIAAVKATEAFSLSL